jgi:hypothetical protein
LLIYFILLFWLSNLTDRERNFDLLKDLLKKHHPNNTFLLQTTVEELTFFFLKKSSQPYKNILLKANVEVNFVIVGHIFKVFRASFGNIFFGNNAVLQKLFCNTSFSNSFSINIYGYKHLVSSFVYILLSKYCRVAFLLRTALLKDLTAYIDYYFINILNIKNISKKDSMQIAFSILNIFEKQGVIIFEDHVLKKQPIKHIAINLKLNWFIFFEQKV